MSHYNAVAEAIRRRQAAGECPFCGGKLVEQRLKPLAPKVCLNEKCGRGRGRTVRLQPK